jgi:oxygen-independent coproporphyrinogen-3 oxidase
VYFGGGTPSLMEANFFESVLKIVGQFSEVTVEVNPEDAKREFLQALKEMGINRISRLIKITPALSNRNCER